MLEFRDKVLIIGYGIVARSVLPLLLKHVRIPCKNITVLDFVDKKAALKPWIERGVHFSQERITAHNLTKVLSKHVSAGGLIIDLAWNIDCLDILRWAHNNKVFYVNTSVEEWDPSSDIHTKSSVEKSLYYRYTKLLELAAEWDNGTTAIVDHGANPGLISHFTKKGLLDIAMQALKDKKFTKKEACAIERLVEDQDFARLAMKLGVKVIHCSERDGQITNAPKQAEEFVGTWSIVGLWEECISPCEIGWGTHERELPDLAIIPDFGPKNMIILSQMGINTWVRSWVPGGEIVGMILTHGESFGISNYLTVRRGQKVLYRPTVHYAYMPSNETITSLHELRCRGYELQPKLRIMSDEVVTGADAMGALIMGHPYNSWWTGSILDIKEARKIVPGSNATGVQVGAGVVAAIMWLLENPERGLCFPEDLPHSYVLQVAEPYLGKFISEPSDWTPLKNYQVFFRENPDAEPNRNDIWQFQNFLFKP